MPLPLPPPDMAEIAEYLATHVLSEILRGEYTHDDLLDSPEIGCLEQVAADLKARGLTVPVAITDVLARAKAAGRIMAG